MILPSTVDGQETSTHGKANCVKALQSIFPPPKPIVVDDVLVEEPHPPKFSSAPSTLSHTKAGSTLTGDVANENKLLLNVRDMVGNAYSREELAESSIEGGTRKYRGVEFVKTSLSPARLSKIMKCAQKKHPQAFARRVNFKRQ